MATSLYDTVLWQIAQRRVLRRDGSRCSVARLLGGRCTDRLDVHHLVPVSEGGGFLAEDNLITACSSHHPMLEALRRRILNRREPAAPRCHHKHVHAEARRQCEERLARRARERELSAA